MHHDAILHKITWDGMTSDILYHTACGFQYISLSQTWKNKQSHPTKSALPCTVMCDPPGQRQACPGRISPQKCMKIGGQVDPLSFHSGHLFPTTSPPWLTVYNSSWLWDALRKGLLACWHFQWSWRSKVGFRHVLAGSAHRNVWK